MTPALFIPNHAALEITPTAVALARRAEVLEQSALIGKCENDADNQRITDAILALRGLASDVEKARKAAKEPSLTYGRNVDKAAKEFVSDVIDETTRLGRMAGDYAAVQLAKRNAEENARREQLSLIERERELAISQAKSIEDVDKAREVAMVRVATEVPESKPMATAPGQSCREDWKYEVTDIWALAKAHPHLVKWEVRHSDILSALRAGQTLIGIRKWLAPVLSYRKPGGKEVEV